MRNAQMPMVPGWSIYTLNLATTNAVFMSAQYWQIRGGIYVTEIRNNLKADKTRAINKKFSGCTVLFFFFTFTVACMFFSFFSLVFCMFVCFVFAAAMAK